MKKLFRKAVSVIGSVALVGATVSTAAAATFPAPFDGGEYAVVYGASSQDSAAANVIASGLPSLGGSTTTVSGGESYQLERTSDLFNLGDSITDFETTLNDDEMPDFLADGVYKDDDREEYDYNQEIALKAKNLTYFEDNDYNDRETVIGFHFDGNDNVMDYTINFEDGGIPADKIEGTDIPLMGNMYYVLSADNSTDELKLLDASATTLVSEGSPVTVNVDGKEYTVSIEYISSNNEVKFNVNGESTDKIQDGEDYELSDGSYIALKEGLYEAKDTGVSKAEFTIGSGKLTILSGDEVELNDDPVNGVIGTLTFGATLTEITLAWSADDDIFLTEDSPETVLPGFGTMKLVYGGMDFPSAEETTIESGDPLQIVTEVEEGSLTLPLLWYNSTSDTLSAYMGDDGDELLVRPDDMGALNVSEGDMFVVSYLTNDEDFATYVYEVQSILNSSDTTTVTLDSVVVGGSDVDIEYLDDDGEDIGDININVTNALDVTGSEEWAVLDIGAAQGSGATVTVDHIFTKSGATIILPRTTDLQNVTDETTLGTTSVGLTIREIDEDAQLNQTTMEYLTLNLSVDTSEDAIEVLSVARSRGNEEETLTDDVYVGYLYSEVASSYELDKSSDLNEFAFYHYGEEVSADVSVASGAASVSSASGQKTFMDSESGYSGKNIVVVGGSCINSVAASLLGGDYCGDDFTGATTVGPGEFLIQTFDYNGKVATLVAGYEMEDTSKAAAYVNNDGNAVMTDVGVKYKGQTATESAVKVA